MYYVTNFIVAFLRETSSKVKSICRGVLKISLNHTTAYSLWFNNRKRNVGLNLADNGYGKGKEEG